MEWFENIKDVIYKRIKGAFGGTFIIIWVIFNWRLIYKFFTFDDKTPVTEKIKIIETHISGHSGWEILWGPLLFSFVSIITYNALNYVSYAITSFFSLRIRPWILKGIDSKLTVEKARFVTVENNFFELEEKYSNEKNNFIKNIDENDRLKKEVLKSELAIQVMREEKESLKQQILDKEIEMTATFNKSLERYSDDYVKLKSDFEQKLEHVNKEIVRKESELRELKIKSIISEKNINPSTLFPGTWIKTFSRVGHTIPGSEQFQIQDEKYFIGAIHYFDFEYIKLIGEKFVEFKIISTVNRGVLKNELVIINANHLMGIENDFITVEYKRTYL